MMIRFITILGTFLFISSLFGQQVLFPFKANNGKWGYCDIARKTVVKPTLKYAELHKNGIAKVIHENGDQGVLNTKGEFIVPFGKYIVSTGKTESVFSGLQSYQYGQQQESNGHYDNVFTVIKDKSRDWYNNKGDKLYTDDFSSRLKLLNKGYNYRQADFSIYFYVIINEKEDHITIISSEGKVLVKDVKEGFNAKVFDVFLDEGKREPYIKIYKGKKKELEEGTEGAYEGHEEERYMMMELENAMNNYDNVGREKVSCQLLSKTGEIIIPFDRGLLDVTESTNYYSFFAGDQSYVFINEMIHESADCEPKMQIGFYAIMSKEEIISPAFDGSSFFGPVYDQSSYGGYEYVSEEDKELLKVINSKQKFNSFQELNEQMESIKDKVRNQNAAGFDDDEVSENPIKGIFLAFTKEDKTLIYKQEGKKFNLYKQLEDAHEFSGLFFKDGVLYGNLMSDYNHVYSITKGVKENREAKGDKEKFLTGTKLTLVNMPNGMYNIQDKLGANLLKDDVESYTFFNQEERIVKLYNGNMYALVNLNKSDKIEFSFHQIIEPYKQYGGLEYGMYERYDEETGEVIPSESMEDESGLGKNKHVNYPQIVITDNGFGAIGDKGEFVIPIQEHVLIFEDFGKKKLIGAYQLLASVIKDKKNVGYYDLKGKSFSK